MNIVQISYVNPVYNYDFPDPCLLKAQDGWYYAYGTQTIHADGTWVNIQAIRSSDLIHWESLPDALPQKPVWASQTQSFWAPFAMERAGRYYLFFTAQLDNRLGMALGTGISDSPAGPFRDSGQPLVVGAGCTHIDPFVFEEPESNETFLFWGSDRAPIYAQALDNDLLHLKAGSQPILILEPDLIYPYEELVEAAWVVRRNGWYILFYSGSNCCGNNPHYAVMVARSRYLLGPYQRLAEISPKKSSVILEQNGRWIAPGHNCILTDCAGTDWLFYHAVDPQEPYILVDGKVMGSRRVLLMDPIRYNPDGWPEISGGGPSIELRPGPVIQG